VDLAGLEDVAAHGAPAQVVQARQLLARVASEGASPHLEEDARRLIDAYLNDPYLTR
jgi:hypothetical protein